MRRLANPQHSSSGEETLIQYRQVLWEHEDLTDASRRSYLSDLCHFAAWYEANSIQRTNETDSSPTEISPQTITTPTLTRYRASLQKDLHQKPDSANRALISLKRYFRHLFGYRMAESVPLHRLAQIMGRDSLDTTRLYIQGTKQDLQQAVETIAWV